MDADLQVSGDDARMPSAPSSLGKPGRNEWKRLTSGYIFSPGELGLLGEYCAVFDVIALLRAELAAGSLTVNSPQAGPVINRAVAEIRACQGELRKLAELLRFRDLAADAERETFPALRDAAGLARARPVVGPRNPRSHRRHAV
jgi:phage terminase small subunit